MKIKIIGYKDWLEKSKNVEEWEEICFPIPDDIRYPFFELHGTSIAFKNKNVVRYPKGFPVLEFLQISEISYDDWEVEESSDIPDEFLDGGFNEDFHPGIVTLDFEGDFNNLITFKNKVTGEIIQGLLKWNSIVFKDMLNLTIPEKEIHYKSLFLTTVYGKKTSRSCTKVK